jgi:hypothetical protein
MVVIESDALFDLIRRRTFLHYLGLKLYARGDFIDRWHGSVNIVFGAVLSAFAGIKLSTTTQNLNNAALLGIICVCHVFFLWTSIESHSTSFIERPERAALENKLMKENKTKYSAMNFDSNMALNTLTAVFGGVISPIILIIASYAWHALFGDYIYYTSIILTWYFLITIFPYFIRYTVRISVDREKKIEVEVERILTTDEFGKSALYNAIKVPD